MTFGETIKELRHKVNVTQEKLAELLSVTPDYLLGMEDYQKNQRKAEYEEAFKDYWKRDDKEENYEIAKKAATEYPGNMEWLEWLASDEWYLACMREGEEAAGYYDQALRHYQTVWENASDQGLKDKALEGIVRSLTQMGNRERALEYAKKQLQEEKRDELLCICTEGEERQALLQKMANRKLGEFLMYFTVGCEKSLERCKAVTSVLRVLFPDGNYQNYHNILQYNEIDRAVLLRKSGDGDLALDALKQARFHAKEMTKWNKKRAWGFTAPLFQLVGGQKEAQKSGETDLDDFVSCISGNARFDMIRERKEFQTLLIK